MAKIIITFKIKHIDNVCDGEIVLRHNNKKIQDELNKKDLVLVRSN